MPLFRQVSPFPPHTYGQWADKPGAKIVRLPHDAVFRHSDYRPINGLTSPVTQKKMKNDADPVKYMGEELQEKD